MARVRFAPLQSWVGDQSFIWVADWWAGVEDAARLLWSNTSAGIMASPQNEGHGAHVALAGGRLQRPPDDPILGSFFDP